MTSLEDATCQALAAAEAGDMNALEAALDARANALERGDEPTPEILSKGQRTFELLEEFIRKFRLESARLKQVQEGFAGRDVRAPFLDYRG